MEKDYKKWEENMNCHTFIDGDVQSDFTTCPKEGSCVSDGVSCDSFMGIKTTEGSKGCCWLKVQQDNSLKREKRLCLCPNRTSTVCYPPDVSLEEEVGKFNAFLTSNGWDKHVKIGRFDDSEKVFDFKVNNIFLGTFSVLRIANYFLHQSFILDVEKSESGIVELIKQENRIMNL